MLEVQALFTVDEVKVKLFPYFSTAVGSRFNSKLWSSYLWNIEYLRERVSYKKNWGVELE